MGWIGWGVLAAVVAGGYWGYRRLNGLEEEIRREIEAENAPPPEAPPAKAPPPAGEAGGRSEPGAEVSRQAPEGEGTAPLNLAEERLLRLIREQPGVLQTELYQRLPEIGRRLLQEQLLAMDKAGRVRRERERGTYRVYPGE